MARSYPTLEQRRTNAAFANSRSSLPSGMSGSKGSSNPYTDAAIRLWNLSKDWEVNLLMNIFGPEKIGSIAAAIDPLSKFRYGGQLVDVVRRRRTRNSGSYEAGYTYTAHDTEYRNWEGDDANIRLVDEYLFDEGFNPDSRLLSSAETSHTTFVEDSTDGLRAKGALYNDYESCWVHDLDWIPAPSVPLTTRSETITVYNDGRIARDVRDAVVSYTNGPVTPIVGNFGFDSALSELHANVLQFSADHLQDYLPKCLTSERLFNAFYQIAELKDLPLLVEKTLSTRDYLRSLASDPKTALSRIDKASADAFLNGLFGYESLIQAISSLCKLPTRASKRFNYLLKKNAKRASQRYKLTYNDVNQLGQIAPSYDILIPPWVNYEILDGDYKNNPHLELRCVVDSTINFPELAVPKFSDSTYRDLLGLNPTISDLYNLIPWTWLGDWFLGVSGYLNLIERIWSDKDLINVGFVTVIYNTNVRLKGTIRLYLSSSTTIDEDGNILSQTLSDPYDIEVGMSGSMDYRTRFSIDQLPGVKSVLDTQGLLTDEQKSILGALLTKFT